MADVDAGIDVRAGALQVAMRCGACMDMDGDAHASIQ